VIAFAHRRTITSTRKAVVMDYIIILVICYLLNNWLRGEGDPYQDRWDKWMEELRKEKLIK
jgi:hypothetical protein